MLQRTLVLQVTQRGVMSYSSFPIGCATFCIAAAAAHPVCCYAIFSSPSCAFLQNRDISYAIY